MNFFRKLMFSYKKPVQMMQLVSVASGNFITIIQVDLTARYTKTHNTVPMTQLETIYITDYKIVVTK